MGGESLQPGQYNTNLEHAITKEGGFAAIGLTSSVLASIMTSADFMQLFPVGAVMMWNDQDTVPTGWQIIPGSHGYYPMAIESGDAYTKGGSTSYPVSAHNVTQADDHPQTTPTSAASGLLQGNVALTGATSLNQSGHTHVTTIPVVHHTGAAVADHTALTVQPPYIQVFLIERVA